MKMTSTQQEILLFTNTRFCARIGFTEHQPGMPLMGAGHDILEDACWKGLIPHVLPELTVRSGGQPVSLWEISRAVNFLDLQFAESPGRLVSELSINPYLFLSSRRLN